MNEFWPQGKLGTSLPLSQSELRSCVKVEADVLGPPVPNKPTVSVDVKQDFSNNTDLGQTVWGTQGSSSPTPETPVPNNPCGLCGRNAALH